MDVIVSALGLVAVLVLGAWWTGAAVADGSPETVLVRFLLTVAAGFYYLVVNRIARYRSSSWARRRRPWPARGRRR
ncbi:MAG: hypothetical protein AAF547_24735 [Actinomycetota bacterium]